jgi:hypothetical protein
MGTDSTEPDPNVRGEEGKHIEEDFFREANVRLQVNLV